MIYLQLFYEFFKIGLFTVGGGMAALPFLYELAEKYSWFTSAQVTDMIAISQSTPGPIGINMATYVGFQLAGVPGSVLATFATVLPECIIVLAVAKYLEKFKENKLVKASFYSIRPAVTALITVALWAVVKVTLFYWDDFWPGLHWDRLVDPLALLLFAVALFLIMKFKKHPVLYIAGGALVGLLIAPG